MSSTRSDTASSSAAGRSRRFKVLDAFSVRDFSLYFSGRTISFVGDGVMYVALPWQVYELSNVPTAMGVVGALQTGSLVVFLLLGGVVADRFERRRVIIAADLLRCAASGVIGVMALAGTLELWHVVLMAVVFGIGQAFSGPATGSVVPDLVPQHLLVQANSALFTVQPLAFRFAGPALGGVLVAAFGAGTAFLVDAASFVLSASALSFVAARPAARILGEGESRSVLQDLKESVAYVRAHRWLWGTLLWALLVLPLAWGPYEVLIPYLVKNELGGDAQDLGLVFAFGGASAVLVSLAISQLGLPRRHITFMYAMFALGAVDLAIYSFTETPWQAMVVAFLTEAGWAGGLLVWNPLLQRTVPTELLGRVRSVDWIASIGFVPLSFAIVGPLADWVGVRPVLFACGAVGLALTLLAYFLPGMRETEGTVRLSGVEAT